MRKLNIIIPVVIIAIIAALSSIYIVDEREKALVLRFGQIKQVREEAGIGFKIPLLDEVVRYDDRILSLETPMIEVTPADDRRLEVDAFVLYRIADVRQFREALGVDGGRQAEIQRYPGWSDSCGSRVAGRDVEHDPVPRTLCLDGSDP